MRVFKVKVPTPRITLLNKEKKILTFIILNWCKIKVRVCCIIDSLETDLEGNYKLKTVKNKSTLV